MALKKAEVKDEAKAEVKAEDTVAASGAAFEPEGEEGSGVTGATPGLDDGSDTAGAVTGTALAPVKKSALAVTAKSIMSVNVLSTMKDAFHVDFDSLPAISATQGSFELKDGEVDLGDVIEIRLLSYQDSWCCSPNDTKADKELVKYGDTATMARDGTPFAEHLAMLKEEGWTKAKVAHRNVLVGELLTTNGKGDASDKIGELVQIDMPDTGRRAFNTYTLQASFKVAKGRKTADETQFLKLTATKAKTGSGEVFTKIKFDAGTPVAD